MVERVIGVASGYELLVIAINKLSTDAIKSKILFKVVVLVKIVESLEELICFPLLKMNSIARLNSFKELNSHNSALFTLIFTMSLKNEQETELFNKLGSNELSLFLNKLKLFCNSPIKTTIASVLAII
jgi:hypothetical protein